MESRKSLVTDRAELCYAIAGGTEFAPSELNAGPHSSGALGS